MTFLWRCCCYGAILITTFASTVAYSFDVNNVIAYENMISPESARVSYSGFSVALWNPSDKSGQSWVFIGAPRANSSAYPDVNEPGTVFKCKIGEPCQEWVMDSSDEKRPGDGSWLGGSMEIQNGPDANIVVCGPRWLDKPHDHKNLYAWPMKGICYQADARNLTHSNTTTGVPILPLPNIDTTTFKTHVMAESGFSIHIVPDSSQRLILGCPGYLDARGTTIQYKLKNENSFLIPHPDKSSVNTYDYTGYAVTSGYYFGRTAIRFFATSAPRSEMLHGKVIVFKFHGNNDWIESKSRISGKQVGEYFGYALASCDIYGDKRDHLIVGAPQWTKIVDEGRIYTFGANSDTSFMAKQIFEGETTRGRFGSAITCLGDIDHDGYEDIAVGAPYERTGAVYIYHGGKEGLRFTQKILGPSYTKGFGITISEPRDIDNNDHADIAVGAYLSGHVILFRTKRAVTTNVTLTIDSPKKSIEQNATSFPIKICSIYTGVYAPNNLRVTKELKVEEILQRAEVNIDGINKRTHKFLDTLHVRNESCQNFTIIIKNEYKNFVDPLKLSVIQHLDTSHDMHGTLRVERNKISGEDHFDRSSAVADEQFALAKDYLDVPYALKCRGSNDCYSKVSIQMMTNLGSGNPYVIGSGQDIELNIRVDNTGDNAYNTQVFVTIPNPIQLSYRPSSCSREPMGENIQVICDIANPLENEVKNVSLSLDMSSVESDAKKIDLYASVTTRSNNTAPPEDNTTSIQITCEARTDIGITRKVTIDEYSYTLTRKEEQLSSIAFQHIYEIKNYEATPISLALVSLSIPTHLIHAGNKVEIVKMNKPTAYLDQQEFQCEDAETDKNNISSSYDATTNTEWFSGNSSSIRLGPKPDEKFVNINGKVYAASPDNRTLHINCSNPLVKWKTINCKLGSLGSMQSVSRIILMFDLLLSNLTSDIIQDKDIILFATNSSVRVLKPSETVNKEPNLIMIGTMFTAVLPQNRVPAWIIGVSIFVGLLLLILLILTLFKCGFFKRNKQMELRALLKENNEATPETAPART